MNRRKMTPEEVREALKKGDNPFRGALMIFATLMCYHIVTVGTPTVEVAHCPVCRTVPGRSKPIIWLEPIPPGHVYVIISGFDVWVYDVGNLDWINRQYDRLRSDHELIKDIFPADRLLDFIGQRRKATQAPVRLHDCRLRE